MVHFMRFHAVKDSEENPELFQLKASVGNILCPGNNFIVLPHVCSAGVWNAAAILIHLLLLTDLLLQYTAERDPVLWLGHYEDFFSFYEL